MSASTRLNEYYPRDFSVHPPAHSPNYKTTALRSPRYPLISIDPTLTEVTGPRFGPGDINPLDHDLLRNYSGQGLPVGERIIVHGHVLDENANPVPQALIEVWQANAGGRYRHEIDGYIAPLDPHFGGCGRTLSDANGYYFFRTIRPGPYPWRNAMNDWRPAHIHFAVSGKAWCQRLITQMYFEGDPLIRRDAILSAITDADSIDRLIGRFDPQSAVPFDSLAYRFDIVLRGERATLFESRLPEAQS
jgi:protocatechuate 3,4-dioxygenase beta subunit